MSEWRPKGWEKFLENTGLLGGDITLIEAGADAMLVALRARNSCVFIEGIRITIDGGTVVFIPDEKG